jgi:hypothetical protein
LPASELLKHAFQLVLPGLLAMKQDLLLTKASLITVNISCSVSESAATSHSVSSAILMAGSSAPSPQPVRLEEVSYMPEVSDMSELS